MSIINLSGIWQLTWFDGTRGREAQTLLNEGAEAGDFLNVNVPGEVHDELVKQGLLAEPNFGANVLSARWVEETFWNYRRLFRAPKLRKGERAWMVFECLDLAATIYLNGIEIGRHANYFYPCRVEVTDRLKKDNVLVVQLESGVFRAMEQPVKGCRVSLDSQLTRRPWLRKPQLSAAFDFNPHLLNVGIQGEVYLETAQTVRIDGLVVLTELSEDLKTGTVTVRLFVEGLGKKPVAVKLAIEMKEAGRKICFDAAVNPGLNCLENKVLIDKPRLWWPVKHGPQNRYTVRVKLLAGDGKLLGDDSRKVGFRLVRVNQDKHPEKGNYFVVEVNNKPIFLKGSNFVPVDIILARINKGRYEGLINLALEANFNCLRVWGGGLYEKEEFYELCDAKGILVWQEFAFACAKYPAIDALFLSDVKKEAVYQVRRLAHHPSLIIWCGNNEVEWGEYNYWWNEEDACYPDYALFHMVLPKTLKQEDHTRYYHPSSPSSTGFEHPNSDDQGDQHPWSIGFASNLSSSGDFRGYRNMTCRFPNEGGILGSSALKTVRSCFPEGTEKVGSFIWEIHDNSFGISRTYRNLFRQWLGLSTGKMTVEDFVYYAGVLQGEGLFEYVKNFRRRMFSSAAAIFWMYNDCWPTVRSWTIVDYYLRRTPSYYPVRRSFAPIAVFVVHEAGRVKVYGVNEGKNFTGRIRYGFFSLKGAYPFTETERAVLPANSSNLIAEFDAGRWDKLGRETHAAYAVLFDDHGREIARDRLFLPFFKDLQWPSKPRVSVKKKGGQMIFESGKFVWRVCLDLDGERLLPDNFFDIYPDIPTVLAWPEELGEPEIRRVGNL